MSSSRVPQPSFLGKGHWELPPSKPQLLGPEGFSEAPSLFLPSLCSQQKGECGVHNQIWTPPRKQQ